MTVILLSVVIWEGGWWVIDLRYIESGGLSAIGLACEGDHLSMLAINPKPTIESNKPRVPSKANS